MPILNDSSSSKQVKKPRIRLVWPGQRFGLLTVIAECAERCVTSRGRTIVRYFCQCECGEATFTHKDHLFSGHSRSCGCQQLKAITRHGKSNSRVYHAWQHMVDRCTKESDKNYRHYGGRGITVCERWMKFENFLEDMGEPSLGLSIDRVNNNEGYRPENCRWATRKEQQNNRRANVVYEFKGERLTLVQWARRLGTTGQNIQNRLKLGWPLERALTEPPKVSGRTASAREVAA